MHCQIIPTIQTIRSLSTSAAQGKPENITASCVLRAGGAVRPSKLDPNTLTVDNLQLRHPISRKVKGPTGLTRFTIYTKGPGLSERLLQRAQAQKDISLEATALELETLACASITCVTQKSIMMLHTSVCIAFPAWPVTAVRDVFHIDQASNANPVSGIPSDSSG